MIEWDGVDEVDEDGRVVSLNLSDNNLRGSLPWELANLDRLEELDLSTNNLTGDLPEELGYTNNLVGLKELHLYGNSLEGCVPLGERLRLRLEQSAEAQQRTHTPPLPVAKLPALLGIVGLRNFDPCGIPIIDTVAPLADKEFQKTASETSALTQSDRLKRVTGSLESNRILNYVDAKNVDWIEVNRLGGISFGILDLLSIFADDWFQRMVRGWLTPSFGLGLPPAPRSLRTRTPGGPEAILRPTEMY